MKRVAKGWLSVLLGYLSYLCLNGAMDVFQNRGEQVVSGGQLFMSSLFWNFAGYSYIIFLTLVLVTGYLLVTARWPHASRDSLIIALLTLGTLLVKVYAPHFSELVRDSINFPVSALLLLFLALITGSVFYRLIGSHRKHLKG